MPSQQLRGVCQVDQWLDFAPQLVPGASFAAACQAANEALTLRTLLAGHGLTVADVAVWGQLKSALAQTGFFFGSSLVFLGNSHHPAVPVSHNAREPSLGAPSRQRAGCCMQCAHAMRRPCMPGQRRLQNLHGWWPAAELACT